MRIIGYIEHPTLKITCFKDNGKVSIKFNSNLYEQYFKFRQSEYLENMQQVRQFVDKDFLESVEKNFQHMSMAKDKAMHRIAAIDKDEHFEEII